MQELLKKLEHRSIYLKKKKEENTTFLLDHCLYDLRELV